jgi:hypothetical protein
MAWGGGGIWRMSSSKETCLALEVLYLDIKDHMKGDLCICGRSGIITIYNLE